ncbi:LysR family transcriptional regulator [Pseudomonas aeruginosa]|uniref:LysR family transcriptional regulator n=1 Tax=Pseudomonas aeruginosa TaxID=287 RepID=UPI00053DDC12|nr:LysR family transcriptional regulator [Pseudomonas aeruginosa]WCV81065.1 LysR family transcriptional regulator [Pseudomonas aeruginosa]HBO0859792.1 LysR family transcriptional regulator [Pseudomonas aeruginosa]HCE6879344.1 LysR family transcriptional regulator [Pseudomonas aeruginosa]HDR2971931.1 LysR family transcriptional regulator [Pseudomonas aeruginosa]
MRIRHLRYFLIVAEEESFARAATRVHIEASPLSRAIKELESELDVHLLHRSNGRIRLTWPGEVFREEARRMLAFMDAAKSRVHSAARGYQGRLRIGLADSLAQPRLARLLARSREEEPLTEIRITEMTVNEMIKAIDHDQIDAGFTVHAGLRHSLHQEVAWTDRPAVAIPKNHPLLSLAKIPVDEVVRHPLILCHPELCSGGHNVVKRWLRETTLQPAPTIAEFVSGHEPMMMLVAAGYGVGVGLESQVALYSNPDVIVRPLTDDVPSSTTFIVRSDRPPTPELSRFIQRAQHLEQTTES